MTEKDKMLVGELYDANNDEALLAPRPAACAYRPQAAKPPASRAPWQLHKKWIFCPQERITARLPALPAGMLASLTKS